MWIPSFPGSGTVLFDISSATESITVFERADVPLLPLSGSGDEAVVWQSPERTVTILTSGTATESLTKVDVGIGTLATITGELVERVRFEEVGSGTISLVGIATEKLISNPPEGTSLFTPYGSYSNFSAAYSEVADKAVLRLSGELVHPDIDYTPHYGIDRNIGIETGFTLSSGGGLNEDGTVSGIVTTRFIPDYPAAGTIFIEGKAIGRTNAPILTDGTIYILGIGTDTNGVIDDDTGIGDLNGVEFGAKERFVPATIEAGPGLFDFTGTAPNRPISVFGYYGDDRDPGTSGTITISTETDQTLYREVTRAAVQAGIGTFSGTLDFRKTNAYDGSGSLYTIGGAAESTLVRPVGAGTLFVSGPYGAAEAYSAQTPENVVTLTLSGDAQETLLITNEYFGTVYASGEHIQPEQDLMLHLVLSSPSRVVQNPSHLLSPPSQFLSALVANLQTDQFRSLDTTETTEIQAHLEQFRLLGNLPIQTSTLLQQSKVQVYSTSLENLLLFTESPQLSLVVLQHYLVLQTYRLPRAQANRHNSSELLGMEKLLSTLYMVTMETTRILVHLVRQQFLVLAIPEKSKYSDITETTEILELQENFNFLPRLLFIHLSITLHLQMVLVYSRLLAVSEFAVFSHQYRRLDPSSVSDRETSLCKIYLRRYRKYHNRDVHTNNHRTCTI